LEKRIGNSNPEEAKVYYHNSLLNSIEGGKVDKGNYVIIII
jgi:hypothetical protein